MSMRYEYLAVLNGRDPIYCSTFKEAKTTAGNEGVVQRCHEYTINKMNFSNKDSVFWVNKDNVVSTWKNNSGKWERVVVE
jgi:hypothetical protein